MKKHFIFQTRLSLGAVSAFAFLLPVFHVAFAAPNVLPNQVEVRELQAPAGAPKQNLIFSQVKKPTVYFFWASWCPYCKEFARAAGSLIQGKSSKLNLVMINTDEDVSKGIAALPSYRFTERQYYLISSNETAKSVTVLPLIILVDKNGKRDTIYEGSQSDKIGYFKKRVAALLNEKSEE